MKKTPDIHLLQQRIASNDEQAYRELFLHYYYKLNRFAMAFVKNRELAEEVVSDVFINLWRKREQITEISNLNLYIYVSARNISLNYLSRLSRQVQGDMENLEVELLSPFSNPEEAFITKEMNLKLKAAIDELPARCKLIFKLVKEDGLKYKEVADLLNLSVSTVDNQLSIAVKKIAATIRYSLKKQNF